MSRDRTKENVKDNKEQALTKIDDLLTGLLEENSTKSLKKADLISYWINSFSQYIEREETFNPKRLLSYSRGDIIRVNFGFRVGKEFGGLHYAVVLDNKNAQSSNVLTVVPLSSTDGRKVHRNNVDLGSELYTKVKNQFEHIFKKTQENIRETKELLSAFDSNELTDESLLELKEKYRNKEEEFIKNIATLERYKSEIDNMKSGSMAVINQITTISKQRIYVPKKSTDYLYRIRLSPSALDRINEKVKKI